MPCRGLALSILNYKNFCTSWIISATDQTTSLGKYATFLSAGHGAVGEFSACNKLEHDVTLWETLQPVL